MDKIEQKQFASFGLLPAFTVGIYDGINPCNFTSALMLLVYLAVFGRTQKRLFWFGLTFILSAILMQYMLTFGIFDFFITVPLVLNTVFICYWIIAAVFCILGILNIFDWWQYHKYFDVTRFWHKLPVFLGDVQEGKSVSFRKKFFTNIFLVLFAIAIAFVATLAGAVYPQREYIFIVYSFLAAGGDAKFAMWSFFQYSVTSVLPLILVWSAVFFLGLVGRERTKVISYYKGITAALFLAVGIGLGYFLLS